MIADELKKLLTPKMTEREAYERGYDCGLHGSNEQNTHFSIFQTAEFTEAWTEGKNDAKNGKSNKYTSTKS